MKVAFFLNNEDFDSSRDFTNIQLGNPGIGGSEYMILLISYYLSIRDNGIDVRLYVSKPGCFSQSLNVMCVGDIETAAGHASEEGFERFVFDHKRVNWYKNPFQGLSPKLKLIPWCHCFAFTRELHIMVRHPNLGRIIYVGKETNDLMRDDISFLKSDYIYNAVNFSQDRIKQAKSSPNEQRNRNVVYMGSLVPLKTFHVLAEMWPRIVKRVPDAQLYVIGSARVYGDSSKLGKFGVAEESYEKMFMPYLTENGKIMDSVHFMGALGEEKNDILLRAKVGVPNPTGKSETFCICAVEMQAMGCSVTAMEAPGYYDTIYNGKIAKSEKLLEDSIVELLLSKAPKSYEETINFISKEFSIETTICDWETLLISNMNSPLHPISPIIHVFYRLKWLKELIRVVKKTFPWLYKGRVSVESVINKIARSENYRLAYHP